MTSSPHLSTSRAAALYVGALLGPSLLLLPGLAAELAGPASILAWLGLLAVSGLLARVFTALGTRLPSAGGVAAYTAAGFGARAGRAVGLCFLAGVVFGAPVVCLIGGNYVEALLGGGRAMSVGSAAVLLTMVLALTLGGARATSAVQLALVGVLIALVAVAVLGSAHSAHAANWTPFAPHGWRAIGSAASVLMLSFVGWEAVAPLTARLADARRQLPRVIAIAFAVTTCIYLALAVATIAVLGGNAGSPVPLAELLRVAVGSAGPAIAAAAAVALTLAATNAYLTGAAALLAERDSARDAAPATRSTRLQLCIAATSVLVLAAVASGVVTTAALVAVPTTLFLTVYLGCTAAAARVLDGSTRVIAAVACCAVAGILAFSGWALVIAVVVAIIGACDRSGRRRDAGPTSAERGGQVANGRLLGGSRDGGQVRQVAHAAQR